MILLLGFTDLLTLLVKQGLSFSDKQNAIGGAANDNSLTFSFHRTTQPVFQIYIG